MHRPEQSGFPPWKVWTFPLVGVGQRRPGRITTAGTQRGAEKRPEEERTKNFADGVGTVFATGVMADRRRKHRRQPLRWTKDLLHGTIIEKVKETLAHRHGLGSDVPLSNWASMDYLRKEITKLERL